ncbi:MAG: FkbM family methyltransferase [Comamonadaceae bacterium]|nr:MAG: FkbM family methyltransferase [Comamonadaceae bacterium]
MSIYVWGCGEGRYEAIRHLEAQEIPFDGYIDSNINFHGKILDGKLVVSPDSLTKSDSVVIGSMWVEDIYKFCKNKGVNCKVPAFFSWQNEPSQIFDEEELQKVASIFDDAKSVECLINIVQQRSQGLDEPYFFPMSEYPQYLHPNLSYKKGETVIEAGGYDGSTAIELADKFSVNVHTFEPDIENFQLLLQNSARNLKVIPVNMALSDAERIFELSGCGAQSKLISEFLKNNIRMCKKINSTTIDNYVSTKSLIVSHIKLDVEGHELNCIHGALSTVTKYKPTLAVAVYHKPRDIIDIPLEISNLLGTDYLFYLGHHSQYVLETIMYCVPKSEIESYTCLYPSEKE